MRCQDTERVIVFASHDPRSIDTEESTTLWYQKCAWFDRPNPFYPIVQRQFFYRQEYWMESKGRPEDRETLTDVFLRLGKEHPEIEDYQPMMHSMTVIGAATEAT
jgi:hypothetical protein